MVTEPSAFHSVLDSVCADADRARDGLTLTIRRDNEFWFVLPDGILPAAPGTDNWLPYLSLDPNGRRAYLLARMAFSRNSGAISDSLTGKGILMEFQPCILVGRTKEGRGTVKRFDDSGLKPLRPPPPPPPEPEGPVIPDVGELLSGLEQTRQTLQTVDTLLDDPDSLLTEDEDKRRELQGAIAATKDRALIGLERLGEALSLGPSQPTEEWRENVHQALTATIEAMVSFEELADDLRDEKRRELEILHQSIVAYFARIDPKLNAEACQQFSRGVNQIILEDRKVTLTEKRDRIEKNIEKDYEYIISTLQGFVSKGSNLPLIPFPFVEPVTGCQLKVVFNMIHLAMAVRFGGLSIKLETSKSPRLHDELRGWDMVHPPRVYITDRSTRKCQAFDEQPL
jgi:hypothetical protein